MGAPAPPPEPPPGKAAAAAEGEGDDKPLPPEKAGPSGEKPGKSDKWGPTWRSSRSPENPTLAKAVAIASQAANRAGTSETNVLNEQEQAQPRASSRRRRASRCAPARDGRVGARNDPVGALHQRALLRRLLGRRRAAGARQRPERGRLGRPARSRAWPSDPRQGGVSCCRARPLAQPLAFSSQVLATTTPLDLPLARIYDPQAQHLLQKVLKQPSATRPARRSSTPTCRRAALRTPRRACA